MCVFMWLRGTDTEEGRGRQAPQPTIILGQLSLGGLQCTSGLLAHTHISRRYNAHLPKKWNGYGAASGMGKESRVSKVALTTEESKLQEEVGILLKQAADNLETIRQSAQLQVLQASLTAENKKLLEENALLNKRARDSEEEVSRLRHSLANLATINQNAREST